MSSGSETSHVAPIIGYHRSPLSQKFGAPRQPNLVPLISVIEMIAPYDTPAAFVGLDTFSHIWISWQFHYNFVTKANSLKKAANRGYAFRPQVRPPRLGGNQKIGVFASRSMYRPSGLGLSVVKLERIEVIEGRVLLIIRGADMIDGTPIVDIKPYVTYSDALVVAESGFASTAPSALTVTITEQAQAKFERFIKTDQHDQCIDNKSKSSAVIYKLQHQLLDADMEVIIALIAQDPRPAYRRDELIQPFVMRYKSVDIHFWLIEDGQLQIMDVIRVDGIK